MESELYTEPEFGAVEDRGRGRTQVVRDDGEEILARLLRRLGLEREQPRQCGPSLRCRTATGVRIARKRRMPR